MLVHRLLSLEVFKGKMLMFMSNFAGIALVLLIMVRAGRSGPGEHCVSNACQRTNSGQLWITSALR